MYRLRLKYGRGEQLKYLSHLDSMRLWERAFRRAGLLLVYSEGFSPHPRISFASPLATGVVSRAEIMDVFLESAIISEAFIQTLTPQLPAGINLLEASSVNIDSPSLQSSLRYAEYEVEVANEGAILQLEDTINKLMSTESLPWHHTRDTGERYYDLRVLIDGIWVSECKPEKYSIGMRLRSDSTGTGRPEQVIKALGFNSYPLSVERTQLIF